MRHVAPPENPRFNYPYFETTLDLQPGTSGGPVFHEGRVVGVNCASWDFGDAEHEDDPLSYIVPISHLLDIEIDPFMIPPLSWEAQQIPESRRGQALTVRELTRFGHLVFDVKPDGRP